MRRAFAQAPVDLVILDLMLPGEDGLTLARGLREEFERRDHHFDRTRGDGRSHHRAGDGGRRLPAEALSPARTVGAGQERVAASLEPDSAEKRRHRRSHARFAGWHLDLSSRELFSPAGSEVRLTTGEFDLLAAFVNNANQVLTRDRLLDLARNREAGPFDRTIDVQVGRLRRKLEDDPQKPSMIKTVRGTGYIFTPPVETS